MRRLAAKSREGKRCGPEDSPFYGEPIPYKMPFLPAFDLRVLQEKHRNIPLLFFMYTANLHWLVPEGVILFGYGTNWSPHILCLQAVIIILTAWRTERFTLRTFNCVDQQSRWKKVYNVVVSLLINAQTILAYTVSVPFGNPLYMYIHLVGTAVYAHWQLSSELLPCTPTEPVPAFSKWWYIFRVSLGLIDSFTDQGSAILIIAAHASDSSAWQLYAGVLVYSISIVDNLIAVLIMLMPGVNTLRLDFAAALLELPIVALTAAVFFSSVDSGRLNSKDISYIAASAIITVFTIAFRLCIVTGLIQEDYMIGRAKKVLHIVSGVGTVTRSTSKQDGDLHLVPKTIELPKLLSFSGRLAPWCPQDSGSDSFSRDTTASTAEKPHVSDEYPL